MSQKLIKMDERKKDRWEYYLLYYNLHVIRTSNVERL